MKNSGEELLHFFPQTTCSYLRLFEFIKNLTTVDYTMTYQFMINSISVNYIVCVLCVCVCGVM